MLFSNKFLTKESKLLEKQNYSFTKLLAMEDLCENVVPVYYRTISLKSSHQVSLLTYRTRQVAIKSKQGLRLWRACTVDIGYKVVLTREFTRSDLFKILANRTNPYYFHQERVLNFQTLQQKQASSDVKHAF